MKEYGLDVKVFCEMYTVLSARYTVLKLTHNQ